MNTNKATEASSETSQQGSNTIAPNEKQDASQGHHSVKEKAPETKSLSLDDLLDKHLAGPEYKTENHKGVDYNNVLENLPSDAKKLIQNLRSDYQRKTTDLSKKRKALELRENSLLSTSKDKLREAMALPDDVDLYNPEGLKQYINAKAAEQLDSLLKPAREQLAKDTRIEQVRKFQAEHPDLDNYRNELAQLIREKGMQIEDAYYTIKGREHKSAMEKKNTEIETYRRAAKEAGFKVSVGTPTSKAKPKFNSAFEAYQWMKSQGKT